ncbi:MAG: hypothetical protein JW892_11305 [Anaerolineae bacterium]|nr:hypothetical protein [Anaerolineae bacterium]
MAFRFTEEDFEHYVKQEEHGGRHIWHELQERLRKYFGVPFAAVPYVARGDRLQKIWFPPKDSPRGNWQHQAAFYLVRRIDFKCLDFGLMVECEKSSRISGEKYDSDRDGVRLIQLLESNPEFVARVGQLIADPGWQVALDEKPVNSVTTMLERIQQLHDKKYWTVSIYRVLSAKDAVALGETVVEEIMQAYTDLQWLWKNLIPEQDREYLESHDPSHEPSGVTARSVLERLIPDVEMRRRCLNLMVDYVLAAHELSPATWEITLFRDRVRLNIGTIQTFVISSAGIYTVLDADSLSAEEKQALVGQGNSPQQLYASVPATYDIQFPAAALGNIEALLRKAYKPLVARAFEGAKRTMYYKSHSPSVVAYLREFLGREIPDPDYGEPASNPQPASEETPFDLAQVLQTQLTARGLHYTPWQVATCYTALQTKGFVILSGISGTGKTKLAQALAAMLPSAVSEPEQLTDDVIAITVRPYMLRHNRAIIPKRAVNLFTPPERGHKTEVIVKFDGSEQPCNLVYADYANTNYIGLHFKGPLTAWFKKTFREGDTLVLELETDTEGNIKGFLMRMPDMKSVSPEPAALATTNSLFVSVRPDWRDSKSLLGFYNPLTGTYQWTPFLRFVQRAVRSFRDRDGLAWFIILDEMNLARVEYYFADLLSILESGRDADGWTREALSLYYPDDAEGDLPPQAIKLPPNLYFVGTVNIDETTHAFSPKVLDRAFTLELTDVRLMDYPPAELTFADTSLSEAHRRALLAHFTRNGTFARVDKPLITAILDTHPTFREQLVNLNALLEPHQLHFGYRVFDEIMAFVSVAKHHSLYSGMDDDDDDGILTAFDAAVLMKVLPKFHGSRGKLEQPLKQVLAWCVNPDLPAAIVISDVFESTGQWEDVLQKLANLGYRYPKTAARVQRMLWALYTSGFAAFG